ncbi:DUF3379 family protein [Uliginosibacterium sp. TH139]|uniref:DUF3379 family protein n=1 Tax=Uliginosibacterium sp. TH139 TaxID=2067453 RepID=UPI000C7BD1F6|nr:DUF3379 family protein [Uliginosibacterium sp. TH139]PLK50424.1 DUF3379 domain-containing protein [Uliginosibacterium sp. TH139]
MSHETTPASCLDFRREFLADPRHLSAAAQSHAESCALCRAWSQRAQHAEQQIAQALGAVPLPEGLNERILLRAQHAGPRASRRWQPLALAASILLSLALGFSMWHLRPVSGSDLAQVAARHANDEGFELAIHRSEPPEKFGAVLASFGGRLQAPLGEVSYIHFCPVEGFGQGWHIIYNTPAGKLTLLLIPAKEGAAKVETVQVEGRSVKVERAGAGYYALIADDPRTLEEAAGNLKRRVRWET